MITTKLTFNRVFAKNFRSISNNGIEIRLDENPTTLICSTDNGAGKSTIIVHAIWFALFDKPYNKDNRKASLVNTRNNKDCLVEVDFTAKGKSYRVRRGIKPAVFEIYEDDVLLEAEAGRGAQQAQLEEILGFDEKYCQNTIILGKEKFVPFASMSAADRRGHIERCLDLIVFSKMNDLGKKQLKEIEFEKSNVEYEIEKYNTQAKVHQNTVELVTKSIVQRETDVNDRVDALEKQKETLEKENEAYRDSIITLQEKALQVDVRDKVEKLKEYRRSFINLEYNAENNIRNFETLGDCPTCKQKVGDEHKDTILKADRENLEKYRNAIAVADSKIEVLASEVEQFEKCVEEARELKTSIDNNNIQIRSIDKQIVDLKSMLESDDAEVLEKAKDALAKLDELIKVQETKLGEVNDELIHQQALLLMLKDDGIKAKIVSDYIPLLNQKVNEYLDKMNLFIRVNIDEEGNVELESPDRSNQQLGSLSTGQLVRVDLAVLFAWWSISQIKSTVDVNLLVLDEILENLSEAGVSDFMNFYTSEFLNSGMNLFVVTQRATEFEEYFDNSIKFHLQNDFTEIVEEG